MAATIDDVDKDTITNRKNSAASCDTKLLFKDIEKPEPVNRERPFEFDELFFSVTDPKSVITYANNVFLRVGAYPDEEIIGQLHKIIRHPDMPASVFKIFWDRLLDKKPVAAYVKNLAKTGEYYWAMAVAFPYKGGYLSVRLKPGSELFNHIKDIYKDVRNYEKEQELKSDKRKAMHLAETYLLEILKKKGFASYDDFMWIALEKEMRNRETTLNSAIFNNKSSELKVPAHQMKLQHLLGELFKKLERLNKLHEILMGHSDYMLNFSRSILLLSMNAQVGSKKLNQTDLSLNVTAENMGSQSMEGEKILKVLQADVSVINALLTTLNFNIIVSKLQVEMTNIFVDEISTQNNHSKQSIISDQDAIDLLFDGFMPRLIQIAESLEKLPQMFRKIRNGIEDIDRFLHVLRFIHIIGKVEVARITEEAASFSTTFQELIGEVNSAQDKLTELSDFILSNMNLTSELSASEFELSNLLGLLNNAKLSGD